MYGLAVALAGWSDRDEAGRQGQVSRVEEKHILAAVGLCHFVVSSGCTHSSAITLWQLACFADSIFSAK
jgi:hypothetical protein